MSESYRVDHHADFAGHHADYSGHASANQDGWSSRKKLCFFLGFATLAWSLILLPFLFLG